jgi:hypothetical protein
MAAKSHRARCLARRTPGRTSSRRTESSSAAAAAPAAARLPFLDTTCGLQCARGEPENADQCPAVTRSAPSSAGLRHHRHGATSRVGSGFAGRGPGKVSGRGVNSGAAANVVRRTPRRLPVLAEGPGQFRRLARRRQPPTLRAPTIGPGSTTAPAPGRQRSEGRVRRVLATQGCAAARTAPSSTAAGHALGWAATAAGPAASEQSRGLLRRRRLEVCHGIGFFRRCGRCRADRR